MPAVVLMQIVLGACYRHRIIGVLPHLMGAVIALLLIPAVSVLVLQNPFGPRTLRAAAATALGVTLLQATLGTTTLVMELLNLSAVPVLTVSAAIHTVTAALTLAASAVLWLEIRDQRFGS